MNIVPFSCIHCRSKTQNYAVIRLNIISAFMNMLMESTTQKKTVWLTPEMFRYSYVTTV